jgi:oligopeptide/dipeptide ABC transporter ATP-binding protein
MYAGFVVETAVTEELFEHPTHPYTVGLLHSIPRLADEREGELIPIEGTPPDQRRAPVGCPFAPRCAWRLDMCWNVNPPLEPVRGASPDGRVVTTGDRATHRIACHNPATPEDAAAGRPLREGFVAAPPPAGLISTADIAPAALEAVVPEVADPTAEEPR